MDYSPWGHRELDMTEGLTHTHTEYFLKLLILFVLCFPNLFLFSIHFFFFFVIL